MNGETRMTLSLGLDFTISVAGPGPYTLIVTNTQTGCTASDTVDVLQDLEVPIVEIVVNSFCEFPITLEIGNSSSGPNFSYVWYNENGDTISTEDEVEIFTSGFYTLVITNLNNGCTSSDGFTVSEPAPVLELEYVTTCATSANDGSIDLTVSGGVPPYTYFWSPGGLTTQNLNDLAPGDYFVQVTDANGCTISELIPLSNLILDVTNDTIVCEGDQLQLFVDAPDAVSFEWFPADNLSCTDCPDPVFTADIFGAMTYVVQVEDAAGCIDQDYIVISVQSYLDFNLLQFSNSPVFEGDTIELYCNLFPMEVDWTGPGNFNSNECNPIIPNADITNEGEYFVSITDEYGCEASATTDVDVLTIIDSIGEGGVICFGEDYQLFVDAPTAVSIEWSPAVTLDDPFSATPIASPTESTHYFVTVENANGDTDVASIFVEIDNIPLLNIVGPTEVCAGTDISICTDSGYPGDFVWIGPGGFVVDTPCFDLENVDESMEGCYEVTYTSPLGCETSAQICIDVLVFQIQSITDDLTICNGESVELEVVAPGAVTYEWVPVPDDPTIDCTSCPVINASPVETTAFNVFVTGPDGCQTSACVIVHVDYDCVWPGDTDTSNVVDNFDLLNIGLAYDSVGPLRPNATILWDDQTAPNWMITQPGIDVDFKHIDCNGDGMINADDTLAITQNWGEMHNFTGDNSEVEFYS